MTSLENFVENTRNMGLFVNNSKQFNRKCVNKFFYNNHRVFFQSFKFFSTPTAVVENYQTLSSKAFCKINV